MKYLHETFILIRVFTYSTITKYLINFCVMCSFFLLRFEREEASDLNYDQVCIFSVVILSIKSKYVNARCQQFPMYT